MQSRRTTDDVAALARPIDDELNAYLKAHADAFRVQRQFTFSHIYLNPERRGVAEYVPDFATPTAPPLPSFISTQLIWQLR